MSTLTLNSEAATAPAVSVIICAYTLARWDDLRAGVIALSEATLVPDEILVVIDHNDALHQRSHAELTHINERVRVVVNTGTRGLSGARNTGIAAARGTILAFCDDDACPAPDWLEQLLRPFGDPRVAVVAGIATPAWDRGQAPAWWPDEFNWVVGCTYTGATICGDIRNPIGASMALRGSVFAAVGGFTDGVGRIGTHPVGAEETELCIRLAHHDPTARIVATPHAQVSHRVGAERGRWSYFTHRCWAEGQSKALIATLVGAGAATTSEQAYLRSTLPRGMYTGLQRTLHGDRWGLARAGAIGWGAATTATSYLTARLAQQVRRRTRAQPPTSIRLIPI